MKSILIVLCRSVQFVSLIGYALRPHRILQKNVQCLFILAATFLWAAGGRLQCVSNTASQCARLIFNGGWFLLTTAYEKLITHVDTFKFLRDWICATLRRQG